MKDKYRGQADRKRKMDEVRTLELLLPHPNCVHFYQSWEESGRLYQQFELCETSLADLAEDKHDVSEEFVWACLVDLLQALQHLHDHSLLHMDIKPENIFIGRDGVCKLGDFGLVIDLKEVRYMLTSSLKVAKLALFHLRMLPHEASILEAATPSI